MCTTRLTIYATDGRASPATRGSPPSPTTRGSLPRDGRASPPPPLVVGFGLAAGHLGQSWAKPPVLQTGPSGHWRGLGLMGLWGPLEAPGPHGLVFCTLLGGLWRLLGLMGWSFVRSFRHIFYISPNIIIFYRVLLSATNPPK